MIQASMMEAYWRTLGSAIMDTAITRAGDPDRENARSGLRILSDAVSDTAKDLRALPLGRKVMVVGNGGSAAIASHVAIDLNKAACVCALALNDASALTCLANDYGYEEIFARQVGYYGLPGDVLIAISSSGKSENILRAARAAKAAGITVITFSGFAADNPLRRLGDLNFYVPSDRYGFVELTHQIILHAVTDALAEVRSTAAPENMAHERLMHRRYFGDGREELGKPA